MDEERVADSFSPLDTGNDEKGTERSAPFPISQLFIDQCPVYMAMGMSYDEYWNGSAERTRAYREAHKIKTRQLNQQLWLEGIYMSHAISATVGNMLSSKSAKKIEYLREPLPLTAAEQEEQQERERKRMVERMKQSMIVFAEEHNRKLKEERGQT